MSRLGHCRTHSRIAAIVLAACLGLAAERPAIAQDEGAGQFSIWHDVPACKKENASATLDSCLVAIPRENNIDRTMLHLWFRDFDGAMREATAGLSSFRTPVEAEHFVGRLLLTRNQVEGRPDQLAAARARLERALVMEPDNPRVLVTLGYVDEVNGDWPRALTRYNLAAAAAPVFDYAFLRRAVLLSYMERNAAALIDVERAVALGRNGADILSLKAELLLRLGRNDEAIVSFTRSLELTGPTMVVLQGRAKAYAATGKLDEALRDLSAVIDGPKPGTRFAIGGEPLAEMLQWRASVRLQLSDGAGATDDYLQAAAIGGIGNILKLQLTLKRLGWRLEIDGVVSEELRRATIECLVNQRCRPSLLRPT